MKYKEALDYINSVPKFAGKPGNSELERLLDALGNPQNELKYVHVAGTNGKGSVCAMLAEIFKKSGLKTGLYTSPYIRVFNERIRVDGENIPDDVLAEIATEVRTKIEDLSIEISAFAQITAIAFLYFKRMKCDIVVLETGLGGRLDATNVIPSPEVCVITKIGLDHTEYLGGTPAEIAEEKCGIIKYGTKVVTCVNQPPEALDVIKSFCEKKHSPLQIAPRYEMPISLSGDFQKYNAGMAYAAAMLTGAEKEAVFSGLADTRWTARFEYLRPNLILDGAHNPDGIAALIDSLEKTGKSVIFVTAMMKDKDWRLSAKMINKAAKSVIVTEIPGLRCLSADELAKGFPYCKTEKNCLTAVQKALSEAEDGDVVCVCGSLYLAGEVLKEF